MKSVVSVNNKTSKVVLLFLSSLLFSQAIQAATKQLYFENIDTTPALTRSIPATTQVTLTQGSSVIIDQSPVFTAPFTIIAGLASIEIDLDVQRLGGPALRSVKVDLYNSNNLVTPIATATGTWNSGGPTTLNFTIPLAAAVNFSVGDFIRCVVTNNSPTNDNFRIRTTNSQIRMQTNTVINIDAVDAFANPYPDTTAYSSYSANTTIYLRATVSDPFGFADISSVDFTVNDPVTPSVFTANTITPEPGASGATAVFETPYSIPAAPAPDGMWTVDFTAHEGTEGTVTNTNTTGFSVGTPLLTVRKSSKTLYDPVNVSSYKAIPGARIEYTIEITNSGFGTVDDDSIIIIDPIPAETTLYFGDPGAAVFPDPAQFIQGTVSSGLTYNFIDLSDNTDDIDFSADGCLTYLPAGPTADPVTGYDITSPDKVNCIKLNPKGGFYGSDGVNNPSFSLKFQVKVN